jgi:energy-converting hydrogenase Eha subunit A
MSVYAGATKKTKAVIAAVGGFVTVLTTVFADEVVNVDEVGQLVAGLVAAALTVYAVFQAPNKPVTYNRADSGD